MNKTRRLGTLLVCGPPRDCLYNLRHIKQLGALLLCGLLPAVSSALPTIERWQDESGAPVHFVRETGLPFVDIHLSFAGGWAREGELKGLGNLSVATWMQGAMGLSSDEISALFAQYGGHYGIGNGRDATSASMRCLTAYHGDLDKALELFINIVSKPDFPEKELARIKKNVFTQLRSQDENPGSVANRTFTKALYGDHPYAHPAIGYKETVEAIDVDDLRDFHRRHIVSSNLGITIVGDVTRQQAETISRSLAAAFPQGEKTADIPPVPQLERAQTIHIPFPTEQVHVLIGQPLIEKGDADFYALRLANHVFGDSGFGSRIMEEVRGKRGLAYSSYSYFRTYLRQGPFFINFQTKKEQLKEALNLVEGLLDDFVQNGVNEEEFELSLASIRGNYAMSMASNQSILAAVKDIAFYQLGLDYLERYLERFDQLDREGVNQTIKKHIKPRATVTVVVGGENPWQ